jgi:redox-sensitive bicupin YhaK (pirin superfamily)
VIKIRRSLERGATDLGWLKSFHTFSFGHYLDTNHMRFRSLRVINDDRIIGGAGFETHQHNNMEIISYVLEGALEHKDSTGTSSVIEPGEVQVMSAGSGISHSEFNHFKDQETHFLQIWIMPDRKNESPCYQQKRFDETDLKNRLHLIGSNDGRDGSLLIKQDVRLYLGKFDGDSSLNYSISENHHTWIHVAEGELSINETVLMTGDGLAASEEKELRLKNTKQATVLLFDMI